MEGCTLAVEVGVAAAATISFITSSVTLTPERDGPANFISGTGLRTQHPAKRFVISSDYSHDSNANDADDEVTSIVRSSMPHPLVFTAVVATTTIVGATPLLSMSQVYIPRWNMINEPALDDPDVCHRLVNQRAPPLLFSQLCSMDYEQLFVEFNVGATRYTCVSPKIWKRIFKKRSKKKAKDKQIQARSEKGKVKSHQNEENTT
ncbi:hypothetical protein Tco_0814558 [Tanacetum coccineum]